MQRLLIFTVILAGMGLSVEAGILGPLGQNVGDLWATFSIFSIGAVLTFMLMLFFAPRHSASFFSRPAWELSAGLLGPCYVVILTIAIPIIGVAYTMIGVLAGQVGKSIIIDHFGLLKMPKRRIDGHRVVAIIAIGVALFLMAGAN
ncbi:transporter family-2 protein [Acinetobacter calcoaceticus]|uniref:Transporter family-2 protein n=1 Tax=Acinetobacter calcoaceticus TaxID=471 RepID=A0A4R1XFH6_ACICA|nr:transporter family-2 protein [Acinetobacter calcoaceticus]